jgi:hypothetical protein
VLNLCAMGSIPSQGSINFSGAFGPIKYLLWEAKDDYGATDMTKGMYRQGSVNELSSLGSNNRSIQ